MKPFTTLEAQAIPYPKPDIDTDQLIPKQFLKTIEKSGLGQYLFYDLRFDEAGKEKKDFILNRPPYREGGILIAGSNFGCGSSREHAPWALLDFGIRCIIAPSFADIFHANCGKNGILPISLPQKDHAALLAQAQQNPNFSLRVDLAEQKIVAGNQVWEFDIDPAMKAALLAGLDEIVQTLGAKEKITAFEQNRAKTRPWM